MTQRDIPDKAYLPGVLRHIADHVSEQAAVALAVKRGGRTLWIPRHPNPDHALTRIVGEADARRIADLLGQGGVLIPCGNVGGQAGRRARINRLLRQGWSHAQIAAEVDVHIRTVERVAAELRGAAQDRQLRLFD